MSSSKGSPTRRSAPRTSAYFNPSETGYFTPSDTIGRNYSLGARGLTLHSIGRRRPKAKLGRLPPTSPTAAALARSASAPTLTLNTGQHPNSLRQRPSQSPVSLKVIEAHPSSSPKSSTKTAKLDEHRKRRRKRKDLSAWNPVPEDEGAVIAPRLSPLSVGNQSPAGPHSPFGGSPLGRVPESSSKSQEKWEVESFSRSFREFSQIAQAHDVCSRQCSISPHKATWEAHILDALPQTSLVPVFARQTLISAMVTEMRERYVNSVKESIVSYTLRSPRTSMVLGIDPARLNEPATNWCSKEYTCDACK